MVEQDCQALIDALAKDMQFREKLVKSGKLFDGYDPQMRAIQEENGRLLEQFIAQYGWPVPSKFGQEIHETAWMIAAHAISKPHLLKVTLKLLKDALDDGETVANEYAKLYDRIELYQGRQQIYGTQFFPSPDGYIALNLFEPEKVDERRLQLGLMSFLENKKDVGADSSEGFITEEQMMIENQNFIKFLKETGWR